MAWGIDINGAASEASGKRWRFLVGITSKIAHFGAHYGKEGGLAMVF